MAQSPIDAGAIPVPTLDAATLQFEAAELRTDAGTIRSRGADIKSTWAGLASVYKAPEDATLLSVMDPVAVNTDAFATDTEQVASILSTFASEAGPLVATLKATKASAGTFEAKAKSDDKWDHDGDMVKQNNAMVHAVNTAIVAFQAAERKAANAIETLIGGHTFHAADPNSKTQDKYAYGYSSIPDNAKTPWGAKVSKKDGCLKSSLTHVGHFFVGVGEGLWGMVKGVGTLAWDAVGGGGWEKFKQAWEGIGFLATLVIPGGTAAGMAIWGPKGYTQRLTAMGKGLVDWDEWKTDPSKAAGNTFANIGTLFIPGAGEVGAAADGAKGASLAADAGRVADVAGDAGKAGKVSSTLSKAGELTKTGLQTFAKYTDPFHYATQLPKIVDVVKGLNIKIPDLGKAFGHDGSALAHAGGDASHAGADAGHAASHEPAPVREPAMAGAGHNTGTHDGSTGTHTTSGSHPAGGSADHPGTATGHGGAGDHVREHGGGDDGSTHDGQPSTGNAGHHDSPASPAATQQQMDKAAAQVNAGAQHWPPTPEGDAAATAYGKQHWGDYIQHLPQSERDALHDYSLEHQTDPATGAVTDPGQLTYAEINAQLRGHGTDNPTVLHAIHEIDKAMNGHPVPHDVVVTRGDDLSYLHVTPTDLVGRNVTQDAYVSTSLGQPPEWSLGKPYLMHIRVPEGTPGAYIGGASSFVDGERELLVGRGQTIHIDDVIPGPGGKWQVYAHIIGK